MCEARELSHSSQVDLLGAHTQHTCNFGFSELMAYANIILTHVRRSWMYVDIFYDVWGQGSLTQLASSPTRCSYTPYSQFWVRVLMACANIIWTHVRPSWMYVDIFYDVWGQETLRSRPTQAYSGLLAPITQYLASSALMVYENITLTHIRRSWMDVDIFYDVCGQGSLRSRPTRAYSPLLAI
jgi:hypothetical protein